MPEDPYVNIDCTILEVREKAVRVELPDGDKTWIPRSLLHAASDTKVERMIDEAMELSVREWFAKKEDLI